MYNTNSSINTFPVQTSPDLSMNIGNQLQKHQEEEKQTHTAPPSKPFTLDAVNEHIFKIYAPLEDLRDQLVKTKDEPNQNRAALDKAIRIIDSIYKQLVFDIPASLDKSRK